MNKYSLKDFDFDNKKVLLRVDFNVPVAGGQITDNTRIIESLPTIKYLLEHNAKLIICSHLGRPDGKKMPEFSLKIVADALATLLKKDVLFVEDIYAKNTHDLIDALLPKDIVLLENLRFYAGEEENDDAFAKLLASFADVYVNDAFGTAHRKHASTYGVVQFLPSYVGFLIEKELVAFDKALSTPEHPFIGILGGAKISEKIPSIENLLKNVDVLLIGGAMSFTFVKAIGGEIGQSLVDMSKIDVVNKIIKKAREKNIEIVLPIDNACASEFKPDSDKKIFNSAFIPEDYQAMDIGPKTIKAFKKYIKTAKTIVWNGPMGVYEFAKFSKGTKKIAKAVAKSHAYSIIGGGDSAASIKKLRLDKKVSHISTGGGAGLLLLEGKKLPCIEVIVSKK